MNPNLSTMHDSSNNDHDHDHETERDSECDAPAATRPRREHEKPTVPVFYDVPKAAVDRAIERFNYRREAAATPERGVDLEAYIYDEIPEQPVIWVDGEPLGEYAGGRVEELEIEPDGA